MNGIQWEPNKAIKMQQDEIDRLTRRISEQDQQIGRLEGNVDRLQASCVAMRGAMLWFCDRVEKGEVRSVRTYARFKEILASTTAGAAMLRVAEAARGWKEPDKAVK